MLMCICLMMLFEHVKLVPQRCILRQHTVILCGSPDGGTVNAVLGCKSSQLPSPVSNLSRLTCTVIALTVRRTARTLNQQGLRIHAASKSCHQGDRDGHAASQACHQGGRDGHAYQSSLCVRTVQTARVDLGTVHCITLPEQRLEHTQSFRDTSSQTCWSFFLH